ncbi:MAG: NAD(P)/FAD-dependent oxidoreductase [Candidatus Margulisiibacteriota bacterium]
MNQNIYDLIVIGSGPAGMTAAIRAAERGKKTVILEKGPVAGRKLLLCGNGRCNVTNAETDLKQFASNYMKNPFFMLSMLHNYSNTDVMEFFESRGVRLKLEPGKKVFPKSNKASDILAVLMGRLSELGVEIVFDCCVRSLIIENGTLRGVETEKGKYLGSSVLIATGGKTLQKTGSTGDGYVLAEKAGHSIIPPKKALYPFEIEDTSLCSRLSGLSVEAEASFINNSGLLYKETGSIMFAQFGLTGPLMINASLVVSKSQMSGLKIAVNFFPGKDEKAVDGILLEAVKINPNKGIENLLLELLPRSLAIAVVSESEIAADKKANQFSKEERALLVKKMTALEFKVSKYVNINKSVATDGGIDLKEIDNKTLESKFVKGLYFAGEVLDVIGKTGGFNLQVAWSTGWTVGNVI